MKNKLLTMAVLVGLINGCGGGGGVGSKEGATLSKESAEVAAISLETLEQPVAMSNFIISVLHQLSAKEGKISDDCNTSSSEIGSFSASLIDSVLTIELNECDITGKEKITGSVTATFDSLSKQGQYLEFKGELDTGVLNYDQYGQQYTIKYNASVTQELESSHQVKLTMALGGNEAIYVNEIPLYFSNSEVVKVLDYMLGTYSATAYADITAPHIFKGSLALRTSEALQGNILRYPTRGKYEIHGANGSYASVSPGSTDDWAKIEESGSSDYVEVSWSDMTSGAIIAFPSRRASAPGEFNSYYVSDEPKLYSNQSPEVVKTADNPLKPEQTLLIIPAPTPDQLTNSEFYNRYDYSTISPDDYSVTADGPWVTVRVLKDLPVDANFTLRLLNGDGVDYASVDFNTEEVYEISVNQDQVIRDLAPFTLKPVKVTDESKNFTVSWTQIVKDDQIEVNQNNATEATIDPSEMTPGEIYKFKAEITDPFGREFIHVVSLMVEDPLKGNSYISYETDHLWRDPNESYIKVIESAGNITSSDAYIANVYDNGYNLSESYSLNVDNMTNGYVYKDYYGPNTTGDFSFSIDGSSLTSNCMESSIQLDVLENEMVHEGANSETGNPIEYQKLAVDFTITCESGTLTGKIRSNSLVE
ncbi:hypothetical protein C9J03_23055 [Photobacterium gaetbulicola]|uniref:Uncharacterized protein n=1 Tax=Photobacterium gaetbulicola Gung47 TaxID=658445 RepID=A0A0C5WFZ7_9GAMM|nr:hypothetical protein [Photobacterium gaetbulicola]AJR06068.1 hypothetical protein H744_1c1043 [Photobacterium gaetbulicola Gung47]PSU02741.1 hypothetical protein C9J03_23055 [Photobacterium gaetbulicola]